MTPEQTIFVEFLVSSGAVGFLVQYLKSIGLSSKWAPVASLAIGLALGVGLITIIGGESWFWGVAGGLAFAGITSTLYDQMKQLKKKR